MRGWTLSSCHNQLQLITGSVILRGDINHFKVIFQHLPKFVDRLNEEISVLYGKAPGKAEQNGGSQQMCQLF